MPEKSVLIFQKDRFYLVSDFEITDLPAVGRYFYPFVKIKDKNSEMTTYVVGKQLDVFRTHVKLFFTVINRLFKGLTESNIFLEGNFLRFAVKKYLFADFIFFYRKNYPIFCYQSGKYYETIR